MIFDRIPFFDLCQRSPDVVDYFGSSPVRIYPGGEAPQNVTAPYATFQDVFGQPEDYLAGRPDADTVSILINVFADTQESLRLSAEAIVRAIECNASLTFGPRFKDPETRQYRVSIDADFINCRGNF